MNQLNKAEIIRIIKELPLDVSDFWVVMGSALVLRGLKESTYDLDIGCTKNCFLRLISSGYQVAFSRSGLRKIMLGQQVTVYENWFAGETELLSEIKVVSVCDIIRDKAKLCRQKDLDDINGIVSGFRKWQKNNGKYFTVISAKNRLRGMVHLGKSNDAVIIVHGYFSANKIGPQKLYVEIAKMLCYLGFTVVRIDLSAMGESDGINEEITFDTHVQNLRDVIMRFSADFNIHLIAHCAGCFNALKNYINDECKVKTLTMISPVMPLRKNFETLFFGTNNFEKLLAEGFIYRKGIYCDKSFVNAADVIKNKNLKELPHKSAIKVYIPQKDELSDCADGISWANELGFNYQVIDNADHNYIQSDARSDLLNHLAIQFSNIRGVV